MAENYFIGLMSGTSIDGIDAVLVRFSADAPSIHAAHCEPMPESLRERILSLCSPGENEIDRLGELDIEIGRLCAKAALNVMAQASVPSSEIVAIGSHGQTIRHRPYGDDPFTLQIGDPNTIAELTGITVVADFRRRDVAAGGQGAPLVPAFHAAMFSSTDESRAVVNIGGMANVTLLPSGDSREIKGFDTGPGNVLLDAWHLRHQGTPLDRDGAWAATGEPDPSLLMRLLADPYFEEAPPKSTGREHFDLDWLEWHLAALRKAVPPVDVQATLAELTARSIAHSLMKWGEGTKAVYLCGGGTHNSDLRRRIGKALPGVAVHSTVELGIGPDWVEAVAFAWLAQRTLAGLPGNVPAVTGAAHPVVLGGIYPGRQLA